MPNQGRDAYDDAEWEALARFVAGESSPSEAAIVEERLSQSSEEAALVAALDRVTSRRATDPAPPIDVERALAQVRNRLAANEIPSLDVARQRKYAFAGRRAWLGALAAALVFIAAIAVWITMR